MLLKTSKKSKKQIYDIDVEKFLCLPANVYWVNTKGELLGYNLQVAKLFNSNLKESLGLTYDVIGKNNGWLDGQANSFQSDDIEVMSRGCAKTGVVEPALPAPDKTIKYYVTTRSPLRNPDRKIIGVFGISIEIANAHQAQKLALFSNLQINNETSIALNKTDQLNFSKRQSECLYHLVRGLTAKQIAKALNLSNRTIEYYLENLKEKLNCQNKSDLIAKAIEMGFGNIN